MEQHIDLLGRKATDKVTGFNGIVTSISFDLYGCVQAVVTPETNDKGEIVGGSWFDVTRLRTEIDEPVMNIPDFSKGYISEGKKGCAIKPIQ